MIQSLMILKSEGHEILYYGIIDSVNGLIVNVHEIIKTLMNQGEQLSIIGEGAFSVKHVALHPNFYIYGSNGTIDILAKITVNTILIDVATIVTEIGSQFYSIFHDAIENFAGDLSIFDKFGNKVGAIFNSYYNRAATLKTLSECNSMLGQEFIKIPLDYLIIINRDDDHSVLFYALFRNEMNEDNKPIVSLESCINLCSFLGNEKYVDCNPNSLWLQHGRFLFLSKVDVIAFTCLAPDATITNGASLLKKITNAFIEDFSDSIVSFSGDIKPFSAFSITIEQIFQTALVKTEFRQDIFVENEGEEEEGEGREEEEEGEDNFNIPSNKINSESPKILHNISPLPSLPPLLSNIQYHLLGILSEDIQFLFGSNEFLYFDFFNPVKNVRPISLKREKSNKFGISTEVLGEVLDGLPIISRKLDDDAKNHLDNNKYKDKYMVSDMEVINDSGTLRKLKKLVLWYFTSEKIIYRSETEKIEIDYSSVTTLRLKGNFGQKNTDPYELYGLIRFNRGLNTRKLKFTIPSGSLPIPCLNIRNRKNLGELWNLYFKMRFAKDFISFMEVMSPGLRVDSKVDKALKYADAGLKGYAKSFVKSGNKIQAEQIINIGLEFAKILPKGEKIKNSMIKIKNRL